MKRFISIILTTIICISAFGCTSFASDDEKVVVIVTFKEDEISSEMARERGVLKADADDMATYAASQMEQHSSYQTRYTYSEVFLGASMEVSKSDIERIEALPYVDKVEIAPKIVIESPETGDNEVYSDCSSIYTSYAHSKGYNGEGTVIAIIDSEFDYSHDFFASEVENPALTKDSLQKIIDTQGLNAPVSSNALYRNSKMPFVYNYNLQSTETNTKNTIHGTHVAGIAAGKNGSVAGKRVNGVAPEAQIAFMAVSDNFHEDVLIAAFDDAVKLGADVVNMSFGKSYGETDTLYDMAVEKMRSEGIILTGAAGNDSRGYQSGDIYPIDTDYAENSSPAYNEGVMAVANGISAGGAELVYTMVVSEEKIIIKNGDVSITENLSDKDYEYVYCSLGYESDFASLDLTGKIALADRGNITFEEKAINAKNAGACGIIIINNTTEDFEPNGGGVLPIGIITKNSGEFMKEAQNKTLRINPDVSIVEGTVGSMGVNSGSGWGLGKDIELKPDITAPGTDIISSVPGGYEVMSGTSMATPHISGAVAVVKQYIKENLSPERLNAEFTENLIMSSAKIMRYPQSGIPYSPRNQGAGMLNLKSATETPVVLKGDKGKTKLSLGEFTDNNVSLGFVAENFTNEDAIYDSVSVEIVTDDTKTNKNGETVIGGMRALSFESDLPQSITVNANSQKTITFNIAFDEEELSQNLSVFKNGFFTDGYIILERKDNSLPQVSIPFTGYYGDFDTVRAVDADIYAGSPMYNGTMLLSGDLQGENYFVMGSNMYADIKASSNGSFDAGAYHGSEYRGYSPNGDGVYDTLGVSTLTLRSAKELAIDICSSVGDTTELMKINNISKYKEVSSLHTDALPDGDYTLNIRSSLPSGAEQVVSLPFYTDTQKPSITSMAVNTVNGREILRIRVTDNRHVMGAHISYINSAGAEDMVYDFALPSRGTYLEFDITGIDKKTATLYAMDYAANETATNLTGINSSLKTAPIYGEGDNIDLVTVALGNYTGQSFASDLVAVSCNPDGSVSEVRCARGMTINNGDSVKSFEFNKLTRDMTLKILILNPGNLKPLCPASVLKTGDFN